MSDLRFYVRQKLTASPYLCSCGRWLKSVSDRHGCPHLMRGTDAAVLLLKRRRARRAR